MNTPSKKSSPALNILLVLMLISIWIYSIMAGLKDGWSDLYPIFFNNILAVNWSGQFNLDFSFYLTLSGLWIMWREKFSGKSILIGIAAAFLGMMAFGIYVLIESWKVKGDIRKLLLGIQL